MCCWGSLDNVKSKVSMSCSAKYCDNNLGRFSNSLCVQSVDNRLKCNSCKNLSIQLNKLYMFNCRVSITSLYWYHRNRLNKDKKSSLLKNILLTINYIRHNYLRLDRYKLGMNNGMVNSLLLSLDYNIYKGKHKKDYLLHRYPRCYLIFYCVLYCM